MEPVAQINQSQPIVDQKPDALCSTGQKFAEISDEAREQLLNEYALQQQLTQYEKASTTPPMVSVFGDTAYSAVDLDTDPTVTAYTQECLRNPENSFTLKPLSSVSEKRE